MFAALSLFLLSACVCSGGTPAVPITSFELLDPTPDAGDRFGARVVILANGNIVVTDHLDSSVAAKNGAVHLYNPHTQMLIASIYGDSAGDRLGRDGITAVANNNFVIASAYDDENCVIDAGSVRLVDGTSGVQIGTTLVGDAADDLLGLSRITALANNNFVIASGYDDENGVIDAGSVWLVDGASGVQIGATLVGDTAHDRLGSGGITALANNNFVIASGHDDENGVIDAGSVRLVDGATGVQIGTTVAGDTADDQLGAWGDIIVLANNNFVIASTRDDENGVIDAGSVRLVDGTIGVQIGATLVGDTVNDSLGRGGITALANNNFVIASISDDENNVIDAGSVRLVDGATGVQIGATLVGDSEGDILGAGGITALANNNFVIASYFDDENSVINAGSVRLVDGTTGVQIGATLAGDTANDQLERGGGITALANNNFVIASLFDDENGVIDAGSVRLVDGAAGVQIGATITGSTTDDLVISTITGSADGDFYILAAPLWDNNASANAGLVRLLTQ